MPKHALLSASASHRWLNCPPSAKLCADIKDEASPYAKQGTDAHSLCEFKVLTALGQHPPDPTDDLDYFDQEMAYCTDEYCSYVMEQLTEAKTHCKDPQVLVEQRLDFSKWIPEGFGTGDCLIVADDVLHIIDFKYGLGVLVEAEDNPQMMCYALGAFCRRFSTIIFLALSERLHAVSAIVTFLTFSPLAPLRVLHLPSS